MTQKTLIKKFNKASYLLAILGLVLISGLILVSRAEAKINYSTGYYTNLCGSGLAADNYSCQANCNPATGECSGNHVVKFICDGNLTDCRQNESAWTNYYKVDSPNPGCNKTVQIDVFSKNCRESGPNTWGCGDDDLLGYLTWYSGDCGSQCPYNSTQVRVHKSNAEPWATSLSVLTDETFKIGVFKNNSGELVSDGKVVITGPGYNQTLDNGSSLDLYEGISLPAAGLYTIYGKIKNHENEPGCFESISVNVSGRQVYYPNLSISKTVKNISEDTNFQESVSAEPLDLLEFKLYVSVIDYGTAQNVRVKDVLPWQLDYYGNLEVNGSSVSGNIEEGINLGSITLGQIKTITFEAKVKSADNFSYGTTSVVNTGNVWADSISEKEDSAVVNVYKTTPSPQSPGLSIEKTVRNIDTGSNWLDVVSADPLDEVEFRIKITSNGSATAHNVIVTDTLPYRINYTGGLKIDGSSYSGDILDGLNIGSMYVGQVKTITFRTQLSSENNFSQGTTSLVNNANVYCNEVSKIYDSAVVKVLIGVALETDFSVEKQVKSITEGHSKWYESISSKPSDWIMFQIKVSAPSNKSAENVIVKDTLPDKIIYKGELEIDGVSNSGNILTGLNIGDLASGQMKTITFKAQIASSDKFSYGTTDLINTVIAYNTEKSETDTAKIIVTKTAVLGATTVSTGVLDSAIMSLGIAFLVTYCVLFWSFLSGKLNFRLANGISQTKEKANNFWASLSMFDSEAKSQKRLENKIAELKK